MIAWLLATAWAGDPVIDAVKVELARGLTLALPDAPPSYHLAALVTDVQSLHVRAQLGGILDESAQPFRVMGVVVRVGSEAFDNTNFDGGADGIGSDDLVRGDRPEALRHDAWLLIDRSYKEAVEALAAKEAAASRRAEPDATPDFTPGSAAVVAADSVPPIALEPMTELARRLSARFLSHPDIEWSIVGVSALRGRRLMIDTGGGEVAEPVASLQVSVVARARAADGATQIDAERWLVRSPEDLPDGAALDAATDGLIARLEAWRTTPVADEEYVGPVVLQGAAALDVVRQLLIPALQGTPPPEAPPKGSRLVVWDDRAPAGAMAPKRRVLPSGWSVDDDPTRDPTSPAWFRYDYEGQPAQKVELVVDGVVRGHLMSRTPSEAFGASNGHALGRVGQLPRAGAADFRVTPDRTASEHKLHKAAIKLAAEYGSPFYVVIRRLRDPALKSMEGGPRMTGRSFFGFGDDDGFEPSETVRVYADGHEEPFRGVGLAGIDLRSFKEVVAAGTLRRGTYMDSQDFGEFPLVIEAPDLLLAEAVLSPSPEDAEKQPRLLSPLANP